MSTAEADVQARLHVRIDPNTGRDLVSAKPVRKMQLDGSNVSIDLQLGYPAKRQHEALIKLVQGRLASLPGTGRHAPGYRALRTSRPSSRTS
jgi:ATP-binding protein involved in chromosome partitioning